ncbi:MAG: hypothetical protein ABSG62_14510 [Terracidiphilus sp.]
MLSIENTKLIHSRIARNSQISMSAKFCVQIAYKQFLEFPNFQQLHLPIRSAGHLKGFFTVYTPSWHSGSLTFDEDSGEPSWNWLLDAGIVDRTAIATA